ncbi:MAG: hypothetical protein C4526_01985 [Nitrospiraceae bacterium]|nr:MAG: hypothetical protein C4526_01985 [Nitrospiraceae bacterium]
MKKVLSVLVAGMMMLTAASCKKKEEQPKPEAVPQQTMQHSAVPEGPIIDSPMPQPPAPGHGASGPKVEFQVVVSQEVKERWSAVRFIIEDKAKNSKQELSAPINGEVKIPDSNLTVKVGPFLPDFKMAGDTITSASGDLNNPAVGVVIYENGKQIFPEPGKKWGWLWSRKELQMMHPFQHERFTLALKEGINK